MSDDPKQAKLVLNQPKQGRYVLTELSHGGHLLLEDSARARQLAATQESIMLTAASTDVVESMTPFDYLFPDLARDPAKLLPADDPAKVVSGLKAVGDAMVEHPPVPTDPLQSTGNSTIPPVYTYWGQFIDHDVTANTDRSSEIGDITDEDLQPLPPDRIIQELKNLRDPTLNLDSVYADGPTFDPGKPTAAAGFYDGIKFRIGRNATELMGLPPEVVERAEVPPPADDLNRDLPRIGPLLEAGVITKDDIPENIRQRENVHNLPFIGDLRNDENLIIAQFHLAVLRFHNEVVEWIKANEKGCGDDYAVFKRAQNLVRWHYQWLTVNDFLKTVTLSGIPEKILYGGPKHYAPRNDQLFMPLEQAVAAYRFGHSMVRAVYDFNRNFGRPGNLLPETSFDLLFLFTGSGFQRVDGSVQLNPFSGQSETLPFTWIIEWDRFINKGSAIPDHFARKIDTALAPPLRDLINEGNETNEEAIRRILKRLARRNLLRGYKLSIPTGQAIAEAMGIPPLSEEELTRGNSPVLNDALRDNGFLERTPLWYYVLKEAEVRANGNSLGELGSRIICETFIGLLVNDPECYLNQTDGWDPAKGVRLPNGDPIVTIGDFLRFAGVAV